MAQSIGVGKQSVSKRLDRLLSSGAILITAFVDPIALGFPLFCNLGVRVRLGAAQTVGSELATMEHVSYVGYSTGTFDLLVEAFLPDTEAVFEFLNQKLAAMDGIVDAKAWFVLRSAKYVYMWEESNADETSRAAAADAQNHELDGVASQLPAGARANESTMRGWTTKPGSALRLVRPDDLDREIIRLLREDGRRPYTDIAKRADVTKVTVAKRVTRLLGTGAMLIVAHVNWPVVGYPVDVNIGIKASRGRVEEVGSRLAALTNVDYVGYTTGDFDIVAEAFLRDTGSLLEFLSVDIAAIPGVESTETWHVLRTEKFNYMWEGETVGRTPLT